MRTAPEHRDGHGGHRSWWSAVLVVAAASLMTAAAWCAFTWARTDGSSAAQSQRIHDGSEASSGQARRPGHTGRRTAPEAGRPRRLLVPDLGVDSRVVAVDEAAGVLTPPSDPSVVGWWRRGARVGAASGTAVITGHTVHTGGGAMDDLEHVEPGDHVAVATSTGTVRYAVRRVEVLSKDALARRAATLFRQFGAPRLVLVTCEDWDGQEYESNVVVTSLPLSPDAG